MNYPIRNLKDIPNVEDVTAKIWREILDSKTLAPYIEDWARERLEKELNEGKFSDYRELEFKTKFKGTNISCNISLASGMYKWDSEVVVDEDTGNTYFVYNDFVFNMNWPTYGSMSEDIAEESLRLMSTVFAYVRSFVSPYKNKQTKQLQYTKEQEQELEVANAESKLRSLILNALPNLTKGMRIKSFNNIYFPPMKHITPCKFDFSIKKKKFECSVLLMSNPNEPNIIKVVVMRIE